MQSTFGDGENELYRQRGQWFLLLGALLGGIITTALAFAFWLQEWGSHIAADSPGHAYQIAVGFAVGLVVAVIVVALLVWRAIVYLNRARALETVVAPSAPPPSEPISAAVEAWRSAVLKRRPESEGTSLDDSEAE